MIEATGGPPRYLPVQVNKAPVVLGATEALEAEAPSEIGLDKTVGQHAGNLGFAFSTVISTLGQIASSPRFAREIPGLNLGVAVLETVNAMHQVPNGDPVTALGHAGNAAGCFSAFAEDVGRFASMAGPTGHPVASGIAMSLGLTGGLLGIVQGSAEIKTGLAVQKASGSTRTLHMGIADTLSGASTVAGIVLRGAGVAPTVGAGLLVAASICDLASIAVDYAGMLSDRKAALASLGSAPAA